MSTEHNSSSATSTPKAAAPNVPVSRAKTVVYACSGCSDAGELADRIARKLTREGLAQMSCLAGIGGRVRSLVAKAEAAERILVIDGCPLVCAKKTLELAGFYDFDHVGLHEAGLRKGSCPVSEQNLSTGFEAAKKVLQNKPAEEPGIATEATAPNLAHSPEPLTPARPALLH